LVGQDLHPSQDRHREIYVHKEKQGTGHEPAAMGTTKHPTNITPYGVYGVVHGKVRNQLVCVCVAVFVCVHILNIPL